MWYFTILHKVYCSGVSNPGVNNSGCEGFWKILCIGPRVKLPLPTSFWFAEAIQSQNYFEKINFMIMKKNIQAEHIFQLLFIFIPQTSTTFAQTETRLKLSSEYIVDLVWSLIELITNELHECSTTNVHHNTSSQRRGRGSYSNIQEGKLSYVHKSGIFFQNILEDSRFIKSWRYSSTPLPNFFLSLHIII